MTACLRCVHELNAHGAGCTVGWLEEGPECHCPNNYDGELAVTCARIGCDTVGTHVDSMGQFFCNGHREGVPIDQVTSWT